MFAARRPHWFVLASACLLASAPEGRAQVNVNVMHHRSTIQGDAESARADLIRAIGEYLENESQAAENWEKVHSDRLERWYRLQIILLELKEKDLAFKIQNREYRVEQIKAEEEAWREQGRRLHRRLLVGDRPWPAALKIHDQFACSLTVIEGALLNVSEDCEPGERAYLGCVRTELAVLRKKVTADRSISSRERIAAVDALKALQLYVEARELSAS